jgi:hypothetical protein
MRKLIEAKKRRKKTNPFTMRGDNVNLIMHLKEQN